MITRGDMLVIALAVLLLPLLYLHLWHDQRPGEYARILVGAEQQELVSLYQDRQLEVEGALGLSILKVEQGRIRFVDSACPNKQCVHSGWIQLGGEMVSCLPNQVSVAILGGEQRFDSINF